jgi:hypothetical protein
MPHADERSYQIIDFGRNKDHARGLAHPLAALNPQRHLGPAGIEGETNFQICHWLATSKRTGSPPHSSTLWREYGSRTMTPHNVSCGAGRPSNGGYADIVSCGRVRRAWRHARGVWWPLSAAPG